MFVVWASYLGANRQLTSPSVTSLWRRGTKVSTEQLCKFTALLTPDIDGL